MNDIESIIETESVSKGFTKTSRVLLEMTPTTALVFYPEIHAGGVRGNLIRFRKNKDDKWEKLEKIDFRKLNLYEGAKIELGTEQLKKLIDEVLKREELIKQGIGSGYNEYVVTEKDSTLLVSDKNLRNVLDQVLKSGYSDDFWQLIQNSNRDLADRLALGHMQMQRKEVIAELQQRLENQYPETSGSDSWQKWIYKNNWLFGVNYLKTIEKQKININGIMPDYLFLTADGFIDILEIKLPSMEVVVEDRSHKGSWAWSSDANFAIGQVVNYLCEIDRLRFEIERDVRKVHDNASILKPRAYILIGNSENWSQEKKEGLRKLNHSLHCIELITYHNLMQRGLVFIEAGAEINSSH